jgi:hypothetical protein
MTDSRLKADKTLSTFRMTCAIECVIQSTPERLWALLTNAEAFPRWNSTVTSIRGTIAPGEKLELQVPAAPGRTFKPRVTRFEPAREMEWSDGFAPMFKGVRTFTLTRQEDGSTTYAMREELTSLMLPMIKGSLPDFAPAFEAYAADLKREAETNA